MITPLILQTILKIDSVSKIKKRATGLGPVLVIDEFAQRLSPMKTPCEDFSLDNLMRRSVMDNSLSGELLTAVWAFKIALCVVIDYHVDVTLY